jgi:DNA-binding GntR family transcriptional regulator
VPGEGSNLTSLAQEHSVSNTVAREAFTWLQKLGLVDVVAFRGCYTQALSADQMTDIFDVRIAPEELAARLAAKRIAPERVQTMQATVMGLTGKVARRVW